MSNMEAKITLLSNEPCREDAFEGHSHKAIAMQIARIIKEDDKRHIIGVEGGWGSGKSNLISLINKELNTDRVYDADYDSKKLVYPFFVYDAWGHQSDFQRRAILEELTDDLTKKKKILDSKKWGRKLEELLAKRKKVSTKEVPKLGVGVVVSIILCVITPLITYFVELVPAYRWWLRLCIAALPYIIGVLIAIINRIKSLKRNGQECNVSNVFSELFLIYKDQIKENETYTTISEKEPSSTEFKAWMDEVDKDLKSLKKTLIIVFDNMDRLPSQKVESLWSSIHSFFSDKTYDRIKVIIPFDRRHVQQAFKGENIDEESFGNDFINKTFDVVFRVPPPIMSGWQQYMTEMWKKAFGEESDLHISVIQVYDVLCKNPTPRKIIAFINEMATVKMTMRDHIPDRYIALFIFGKEEIEKDPIGQLLNPRFMGDVKFEYEKDSNTIKYLSALYYQLPVDRALDVVFTKEATEALNSGNEKRLQDMAEQIELSSIMGNAILKVTDVEKATMALAGLDGLYGVTNYGELPSWLKQIWDALYQKCRSMDVVWNEIKGFHVPLFTHLYDDSLADSLVKGYLSIEDEKWDAKLYVDTIDKLSVDTDTISIKLDQNKRKVTPKLFLDLLKYTEDKYEKYGITCDLNELDVYLSSLEMNELLLIEVIPFINEDLEDKEALTNYKIKLRSLIEGLDGAYVKELSGLFEKLKEVESKPLRFDEIISDENIFNAWCTIEEDDKDNPFKYDLLAMRIARRDSFNAAYASVFQNMLNDSDETCADELADVIECYINYGDLLLQSSYYKTMPLAVKVVDLLTKESRGTSRADITRCLVQFDQIVGDYEIDPSILFNRLSGWVKYVKPESVRVDGIPSGLLQVTSEIENELSKTLHEVCEVHYASLSQNQWKEHILQKDDTYRLWEVYHPKRYQANYDALKFVLKEYAIGVGAQQPEKQQIEKWLDICQGLGHPVKDLIVEIYDVLTRSSVVTKEKLLFFGPLILKYMDHDKLSAFIEKLIPTEIIDEEVVGLIVAHVDQLKECAIPDDFREKIKHLAETSMKKDARIQIVCDKMKIEIGGQKVEEE